MRSILECCTSEAQFSFSAGRSPARDSGTALRLSRTPKACGPFPEPLEKEAVTPSEVFHGPK
jgi:hypothetical protein